MGQRIHPGRSRVLRDLLVLPPISSSLRYKQHVFYWYPDDPDYYYVKNMETKKYWGRCSRGGGGYSMLREEQQAREVTGHLPGMVPRSGSDASSSRAR